MNDHELSRISDTRQSDTITLRRAAEQAREALNRILDCEQSCQCIDRRALAALDAALAEPDVADLFAQFAAKQKSLDADMAAILHANLDSLYITEDALREGIDAKDRDLWQRRADEEVLKEYETRMASRRAPPRHQEGEQMTRDDIIRWARGAGFPDYAMGLASEDAWQKTERFVALVAAAKQEQMKADGWRQCAVGQRTTQFCGIAEAERAAEREACARVCENGLPIASSMTALDDMEMWGEKFAAAIRARGII